MKKSFRLLVATLVIAFGCDRPLDFDLDFEGEKLVVFSKLSPNQPITVYVSKSANPYSSGIYKNESYIIGANVTVLEDGEPFTSFIFNEDYFVYVGDSEFGGSDGHAEEYITQANPDYQVWFSNIWEPPGSEIESLLFALQAAIGAGVVCYIVGYYKGKKACEAKVD